MKDYTHIKKLIDWSEKFESQLSNGESWSDEKFSNWLINEINTSNTKAAESPKKSQAQIMMYVVFMYKYALFYSRKIFKNSKIYSIDDFSFLASLMPDKKLKKADVIRKNISEKSSGNEVLKRLLRHGLIKETDNPSDKRSKLLELSPDGLEAIQGIRTQIYKVSELVNGDLSEQEITVMLTLLEKLNVYHRPIFDANDEKHLNSLFGIESSAEKAK